MYQNVVTCVDGNGNLWDHDEGGYQDYWDAAEVHRQSVLTNYQNHLAKGTWVGDPIVRIKTLCIGTIPWPPQEIGGEG